MQLRTTLECNGRFSPYYAYWLFSLFSRHIFRTQSFQQNRHIIFLALVALMLLVSLISRLVACSARIVVDRHTDTQTHRQTHRTTTVTLAAHARRGLIMAQATSHAPSLASQPYFFAYAHARAKVGGGREGKLVWLARLPRTTRQQLRVRRGFAL